MKRQAIDGGKWFDLESATKFAENTRWDGRNHISVATGDQWSHEDLYRTAGGRWVKNSYSQWQGSSETWEEINEAEAAEWLVSNGHDSPIVAEEIAANEI